MITALDDLAGLDHQEQIGVPNRAQAVRDNEAGAFGGCCAGCPAAGEAVFSASDQHSYRRRRANHLEMVTAVHLALRKYWFVGRDQLVSVGW